MLTDLLKRQKEYLDYFFLHLDVAAIQQLLERALSCQGALVFTGIGKSGLVAQKVAFTLTSTGTKALFLSPTNALHGDMGIVTSQDLFIFFSKGGESDELLQMVPFLRNKGVHLVATVCDVKNRLSKACDTTIVLPCHQELCPFDLVPTTSAAVQMIFGDLLAVSLMQSKNFSLEEYASNHPAGKIGKRIAFKVADLMLKATALPLCSENVKVMDILVELSDKRCGCLLVVDEMQRLLGIFTDGDLRRALQKCGADTLEMPVGALMNPEPKWIGPEELAWRAIAVMEADQKRPVAVLPVLDQAKQVVGLLKMHDIVQSGLV